MRLHLLAIAGCAALTACAPYAEGYYGYGSAPVYAQPGYGYGYGYPAYGYGAPAYAYGGYVSPGVVVVGGERRWDNGWDRGRWERERGDRDRAGRESAWRGRGDVARPQTFARPAPAPVARAAPAAIPNPPAGGPAFDRWYHRNVNGGPSNSDMRQ